MSDLARLAVRALAALVLIVLVGAATASAQVPTRRNLRPPGADSVRADTARADSARAKPVDAATDSVLRALRALQGYTVTEYEAKTATYTASQGVLRLKGEAQVKRDGNQQLTADTIVYREGQQLVEAYGKPKVVGEAQELAGSVLYYDLARRRATALGARTQVQESGNWIVTGDLTAVEPTETVYGRNGHFTTCDLTIPHYHFESDQIKVVRNKYLVARPARMYFGKVPVFWFPFIVQNLEQGRSSGLIVPKFSVSDIVRTSRGYTREINDLGWYWAVSPYVGAQLSMGWRSGAYTSLTGNVDYKWRKRFLDGSFAVSNYWREQENPTFTVNSNTRWQPDERSSLSLGANFAGDAGFVRRSTVDPRETTQNLRSTLSLNRRFDWGTAAFGSTMTQSVNDGSLSLQLPSFSISPQPVTLFRSPTPEQASWYNNATFNWNLNGSRQLERDRPRQPDMTRGTLNGTSSLTIGNLNLSLNASSDQQELEELFIARDSTLRVARDTTIAARLEDVIQWSSSIGYQQKLIGQTTFTPSIGLSQTLRRDTRRLEELVQAPIRLNFGANVSTALFGFYPGVGPFSRIRHRVTPSIGYNYAPNVRHTALQDTIFGTIGSLAQNVVNLTLNQTFEAKLRARQAEPRPRRTPGLVGPDSAEAATTAPPVPSEPQKVTILSISTSAIGYDFVRAANGQSGFTAATLQNTLSSDYLRGLNIQIAHELFDASSLDPARSENTGRLGTFAPRLSTVNTGFSLGPDSWIFRWLGGVFGDENPPTQGIVPGTPPTDQANPSSSTFTGNPQGTGHGPWSVDLRYSFNRAPRTFGLPGSFRGAETVQTLTGNMAFGLTPNWAVTWSTDYSITDNKFGAHILNFRRDLHRWQANLSYYLTPTGNSSFQFFVELIDNRDLKVQYRERNLGIDRRRF